MTGRLIAGQAAPRFEVADINGDTIRLEDFAGKPLLISFHRFAACPLCNLHSDQLAQYYPIWHEKGLNILSFYQSSADVINRYVGSRKPPYAVIADPEKMIYVQYGVEKSMVKTLVGATPFHPYAMRAMISGYMPTLDTQGGDQTLIPADFLLNPDLTIHTAHYGKTAAHHLPVRDVAAFLRTVGEAVPVN